MDRSGKSTFSIVDLIALLVVGFLLLSLLTSCVARQRGPSKQNLCLNQLRQLALCILNKESATQRFPLAMFGAAARDEISTAGPTAFGEDDGYSWIVGVLAYADRSSTFKQILDESNKFEAPIQSPALSLDGKDPSLEELLICPAMPGDHLAKGIYRQLKTPQISNYMALVAACVEGEDQRFADRNRSTGGAIVTKGAAKKGLKIGDITDGTSKTMILAESKAELYSYWFSGRSTSTVGIPPDVFAYQSEDDRGSLANLPQGLNFGRSYSDENSKAPWFATKYPPGNLDWGPSSHHPAGVGHAFVGGACSLINPDIDTEVYFALLTRGGGEKIPE